jgi:hypothetical protein
VDDVGLRVTMRLVGLELPFERILAFAIPRTPASSSASLETESKRSVVCSASIVPKFARLLVSTLDIAKLKVEGSTIWVMTQAQAVRHVLRLRIRSMAHLSGIWADGVHPGPSDTARNSGSSLRGLKDGHQEREVSAITIYHNRSLAYNILGF